MKPKLRLSTRLIAFPVSVILNYLCFRWIFHFGHYSMGVAWAMGSIAMLGARTVHRLDA